ncbi:MAG: hypothetical protein GX020_04285 [Firmicutes bacterium]|nr:hypothetical protein [Bacillota bacterium]
MKRSISVRISIYIGILLILICTGLGLYSNLKGSSAVMSKVEEALLIQADQASKYFELHVDKQLSALESISARAEIRSMDWQQQQPVLVAEIERLQSFEAFALFNTQTAGRAHTGAVIDGSKLDYLKKSIPRKKKCFRDVDQPTYR